MHKTAYEMRISDCSSDVCSSDLRDHLPDGGLGFEPWAGRAAARVAGYRHVRENRTPRMPEEIVTPLLAGSLRYITTFATDRSEEHTSELQSLMRISYAVFCLKNKITTLHTYNNIVTSPYKT